MLKAAGCLASMLALLCGLASAVPAPPPPARTPEPPVSIDVMAWSPGMLHARLSPDGKHIAAIMFNGLSHALMLAEVDTLVFKPIVQSVKAQDGFYEYDKIPRFVVWVDNDLIAVDYTFGASSVNLEGKFVADLGEGLIGRVTGGDPASPMVLAYTDLKSGKIARINARTGKKTRFNFPMSGRATRIAYDAAGEPRAVTMIDAGAFSSASSVSNWYRPGAGAAWQKLAEFKVSDDYWVPLYVPEQPNSLVIRSRAGRDTFAIFSYDTSTRTVGDMMAGHPSLDIVDVDGVEKEMFKRVWTSGMQPTQYWFDPAWAKLQLSVDAALPNRINILSGNPEGRVLVYSYADVDPGAWYILDTGAKTMRNFGTVHSSIDPAAMRPMESISYPSKDGLSIPAYLTLPPGPRKALPTVVMLHGGPSLRDRWAFNVDVQLLASRGYAVLQPQFRGSSGFGRKFQEAGYGQWGLAMQDDVTAGVEHLVRQGIADPSRVCLYGASYGGYAALWGLVKTPQLYRCAISFAGVTDLELMFKDSSDRNANKVVMELLRSRVGDSIANKEQFEAVSPLRHAARITAPVLLMHGELDRRVPIVHANKFRHALKENGKSVEWMMFEDEGHTVLKAANQRLYFQTILQFLDKHIGPQAPAAAAKP